MIYLYVGFMFDGVHFLYIKSEILYYIGKVTTFHNLLYFYIFYIFFLIDFNKI